MAGDWIKFEHATLDKPEVLQIAELLKMPINEILGGLLRVWVWMDRQSRFGNAVVTLVSLNRIACVTGLAEAMQTVGWLTGQNNRLVFVNFERHNGQTAKTRALTNKRQVTFRSRKRNADTVTTALPEKRREEKSKRLPLPPCQEIVTKWNALAGVQPCALLTPSLTTKMGARWREHPDLAWWDALFARIGASDFLCGRKKDFRATLDWVCGPKNLAKIVQGNYDPVRQPEGAPHARSLSPTAFLQLDRERAARASGAGVGGDSAGMDARRPGAGATA